MHRRTLLAAGASGAAGLAAGPLLASNKASASASIALGNLTVEDAETTTDDGTVNAVTARVAANYEYDIPGGNDPDAWRIELLVTDGDRVAVVDTATGEAKYLAMSGSSTLQDSVTSTDLYDASDFAAPADGETARVTLGIGLTFAVRSPSDRVLAASTVTDTATVAVTDRGYNATRHGSVGGDGSLTVE